MSADKDSAPPSGINVSGKEMHGMLKELKPLLWTIVLGTFVVVIGYGFIEYKKLEIQHLPAIQVSK